MRRLWTVALAGLTAALLQGGLTAKAGEPMRVRLLSGKIVAEGEIRADTPAQFRKVISQLNGRKRPIVITSPGGRLSAALTIGRMIRKARLDVTVSGTCTSACPFVLVGGVERRAELDAVVGVHRALMIRSGRAEANGNGQQLLKNSKATAKQFRLMRARLRAYLGEMGVSPELVGEMDKASPFEMNVLSAQRLEELKLVTVADTPTVIVSEALVTGSMEPLP
jgi:hypothetical protein